MSGHNTTWLSACFNHVYRIGGATYEDDAKQHSVDIDIGSIRQPYWATYFSYNPETLEWVLKDDPDGAYSLENVELTSYGGRRIYLYDFYLFNYDGHGRMRVWYHATWVDETGGVLVRLRRAFPGASGRLCAGPH